MAAQIYGSTFPVFNDNVELFDELRKVECPVTLVDLNQPTATKLQAIYEWWMVKMLGLNTADCVKAAEQQMDQMDQPEIYREAIVMGVFQTALNQLLVRATFDDFTNRDLAAPTSVRVHRILAALLNFYLFEQEQALEYLQPLMEEDAGFSKKEQELLQQNETMRLKIEAIIQERKENEPKVEEHEQSCQRMAVEMRTMHQKSETMRAVFDKEQVGVKQLYSEANEVLRMTQLQELEILKLKGQIVQSPDRLRTTLADLSNNLQREHESLREFEAKERTMLFKIQSLKQYESDLGNCLKILDEWAIDVGKVTEATTRYEKHLDAYELLQSQQDELDNEIKFVKRRLNNAREELSRLEDRTEAKRQGTKQKKRFLEDRQAQLLEEKRYLDLQAAQKNKEAIDVENQIRAIHLAAHAELDKGDIKFREIKDQVSLYSIRLNKALDSINAANSQQIDLSG